MQQNLRKNTDNLTAVILAGGNGTRLRPLTNSVSKSLLPLGSQKLIDFAISNVREAGVRNVVVTVQSNHANQFFDELKDGREKGVNITFVWHPQFSHGMPYALGLAEHICKGIGVLVTCADMIIDHGFKSLVQNFLETPDHAHILTANMVDTAGFSLLDVEGDKVEKIYNKDKDRHKTGIIDLGTAIYPIDVFQKINTLYPYEGERGIWELNQLYLDEDRLNAVQIEGFWSDAGKDLETYIHLYNKYASKHQGK